MDETLYMVFDVESIGLHGDGFAVGYVVVDGNGREEDSGLYQTNVSNASGKPADFKWIAENVTPALEQNVRCRFGDGMGSKDTRSVRDRFWEKWEAWKGQGARLAADVAWPVEARFLIACINDDPIGRAWSGPYPLIDIASVRLAVGLDPLATVAREEDELPAHNPLADARQSARLLIEALAEKANS